MINEEIRENEIRLIGPGGEQLGVIATKDALAQAAAQNLDLVKIAPTAKPPVCKIIDYGKYKFELSKKDKEIRKNQKIVNIKEVRLSPNIDDHDFDTKLGHALKFLKAGDKVKVSIRFRGREVTHSSLGEKMLLKFSERITEENAGNIEKRPKLEGKNMFMFISPTVSK